MNGVTGGRHDGGERVVEGGEGVCEKVKIFMVFHRCWFY